MACDTEDKMALIFNATLPSMIKELDSSNKGENDESITFILQQLVANFKIFTSPIIDMTRI